MQRHRWGRLLHASMSAALAGCASSAASPPAPPPPASDAPPPASSAAAPPGPSAGLGPLALALPPATGAPRKLFSKQTTVRFGDAALIHADFSWMRPEPPCPLAAPDAPSAPCALYSIAAGSSAAWSTPRLAPSKWIALARGRSVAYALREADHVVIDAIAADGSVSLWLDAPEAKDWSEMQVIESSGGDLLVGCSNDDLIVARVMGEGKSRHLGDTTPIRYSRVDSRPNANRARVIASESGNTAMWGPWSALSLDGKTDAWALVYTEVQPPPPSAPEGKPYPHRSKAKHGCGGKLSRSLDDRSVGKRLHVVRFAGGKQTGDTATALPDSHNADKVKFQTEVVDGRVGVWLDGKALGERTGAAPAERALPAPPMPATLPEPEAARALAFDRASGEGLLLVTRGDEDSFGRLFDASGRYLGEPFPLPDGVAARGSVLLARGRGGWLAYEHHAGRQLTWITGNRAGKTATVPDPDGFLAAFAPLDDAHVALVLRSGANTFRVDVGVEDGSIGEKTKLDAVSGPPLGVFARGADKAPLLITEQLATHDLRTGELLSSFADHHSWDQLISAWDGPVATNLTSATGLMLGWPLVQKAEPVKVPEARRRSGGPVLEGGLVLPGQPGPLLASALKLTSLCPLSVATGPRTIALACAEGQLPAAVRSGLRLLVLDAP